MNRPLKRRVVHLAASTPLNIVTSICQATPFDWAARHQRTTNPEKVTCKRCLSTMAQRVEEALTTELMHFDQGRDILCGSPTGLFTEVRAAVTCNACLNMLRGVR